MLMFFAKSKFEKLNLKSHALPSRLQARPSAKFKTNIFMFKKSQPFTYGKISSMSQYLKSDLTKIKTFNSDPMKPIPLKWTLTIICVTWLVWVTLVYF